MKHFCFAKYVVLFIVFFNFNLFGSIYDKSAVVYYGHDISYPLVGVNDYIVVDPNNIEVYTTGFKKYKKKIYAYVSINEMIKTFAQDQNIDKSWIIGENSSWGSYILDISNQDYQHYLLSYIKKLKKRGFENFFFDTIDSYKIVKVSKQKRELLKESLISFIKKFSKEFPKSKLIINRGFDIIDDIHDNVTALLFESYYKGIDLKNVRYKDVSKKDRLWIDKKLKKVKFYNIDIIALDYMPLYDFVGIKEDIKKLQLKGFIPYVTDKSLNHIGYSSKNVVKREILILYNSKHLEDGLVSSTNAHLFASMPLEYMGYIPVLKDINKKLPSVVTNRYAGVIVWMENSDFDKTKLNSWIIKVIKSGEKVLFLGDDSLDLNSKLANTLGINISQNTASKKSKNTIISEDNILNFETVPSIGYHKNLIDIKNSILEKTYLIYENSKSQKSILSAKTTWGGFVRDDSLMSGFFGDNSMWIINPFRLFSEILELKKIVVPDPTTENGKRLSFLHIDGDGSMNRVENNTTIFSIELIEKDFIKKYHFPQSVSIVESETAPYGKYPKYSKRLEAAAKKIYSYPYVEAATHTFMHPYDWQRLEKDPTNEHYRTHWKVEYSFTPKREILDSLEYINSRLVINKKKYSHTLFWSGDCMPSKNVVKFAYKHNIININGGDTTITNDNPWLQLVQSFGIKYGNYYQVYTGEQNENVYTNDWRGPFWGFKKVIQTFKLTNRPRRLKPVDVYFHFYSASKRASYQALKDVYNWVVKQDLMHIFTSEYPPKVTDFYDTSLACDGRTWLLEGFDHLRTVRVGKDMGVVDIQNSNGVVGYSNYLDNRYVHLDDKDHKVLVLSKDISNDNLPYLVSANARVVSSVKNEIHFKGYMPVKIDFHLPKNCHLKSKPKVFNMKRVQDGIVKLRYKNAKEVYVKLNCS